MDSAAITTATQYIGSLYPVCLLDAPQRENLLASAHLEPLRDASRIEAEADERWISYLLKGELELVFDDEEREWLQEDRPRSHLPLFPHHSPGLHAVSKTKGLLLRLDHGLYQQLAADSAASIERDAELFDSLYQAYLQDTLPLPSPAAHADRLRKALEAPSLTLQALVQHIHTDPALAARLMQTAHSLIHGQHIPHLSAAIDHLGLETCRELATALTTRNLFTAEKPPIEQRLKRLYEHSLLIASLCYILARQTHSLIPDRALLAGLLHDIGSIPLLVYLDRDPDRHANEHDLDTAIERLRGLSGQLVLDRLGLEPELIAAAANAEQWMHDSNTQADYSDLVTLAHLYSNLGTEAMHSQPHVDQVPAYKKLFAGPFDPLRALRLLGQAKQLAEVLKSTLR